MQLESGQIGSHDRDGEECRLAGFQVLRKESIEQVIKEGGGGPKACESGCHQERNMMSS